MRHLFRLLTAAAAALAAAGPALADGEVNVYSHRHYDTDQALYDRFGELTGITVNVLQGSADELIGRLSREGAASPADVLMTVDAGRLVRAQAMGLLQPAGSDLLRANVPEHLRDPGGHWFGLTRPGW